MSCLTEYSVLISFRTDWFDFLAVQGTLKNLPSLAPQFESISYSELSLLYGPTLTSVHDYWKTIDLTIWTFVSKVMSLLFSTLSSFVITFLPGGKCLLFSWLQSPSIVILEPKKIKSVIVTTPASHICHEVLRPDAMILVFLMLSFKAPFSLFFCPPPEAL